MRRLWCLGLALLLSLALGGIAQPTTALAAATAPHRPVAAGHVAAATPLTLQIQGNHFIDSTGAIVTLRGASHFGYDLTCTGGGHFALADFQQMQSWGMNAVRIPMNSTYWLYGDNNGCTAQDYQANIAAAVQNAEAAGLYVILVGQWSVLQGNSPMAYPQDLPFWQQVSQDYASDPHVGFVPVTEPHVADYATWYNGWNGGPGMLQLVQTIDQYAPNHIIFVNGLSWADDLSFLNTAYAITGPNIAYELHIYSSWNPTTDADPYMSKYVVTAGEFGTNDWNGARHNYNTAVMSYFEQHQTGYFAWGWNVHYACDTNPVIFDSAWGNLSWFGQLVHDFLASVLNPSNPPPNTPPPPAWTCADIGPANPQGSDVVTATSWTTNGGGSDIWLGSDQFHYDWQSLAADGSVSAQVLTQSNTSGYAKAGVMLRQSTDPTAAFYAIFVTPSNGLLIQYRSTAGANAQQAVAVAGAAPAYVKVGRSGQTYTAYTSTDGVSWTAVAGSTVTLPTAGAMLAGLAVTSHNGSALSTVTFGSVAITNSALAAPPGCATGWTCGDVGLPALAGSSSFSNGTWTISGGGNDIWGAADQFQFASQSLAADGSVSAQVLTQTDTSDYAKAGVMLRQSTDAAAPYYFVAVSPINGILIQYRTATGANAQEVTKLPGAAPAYVQIERSGQDFTAYTSTDGVTWTAVPNSTILLQTSGAILAGLAVTSHNGGALSTATFNSVAITNSTSPPPSLCPTGWTCGDIGAPAQAGSSSFSDGTWTINGGGNDIWGGYDQFQFAWQSLAADGTISAQVLTQSDTSTYAKAGVMLRQSTDPTAPDYLVAVTPINGILIQYRTTAGANAQQATAVAGAVPAYLRIGRSGQTFTAYTSTDGVNWTAVPGSSVTLQTTGAMLAGLAVTSHNGGSVSTATFNAVATTNSAPVPPCPSGWTCGDIGSPAAAGSESVNNGTWTVNGAGYDIWLGSDQFHYDWQSLAADGSVSAQVLTQSNTSGYAKAGVMLRQSTDPTAAFYAIFVTPSNGLLIQYRSTAGANAQQAVAVAGAAPAYVKVGRSGQTYTAYTSTDGVSWTAVAGSTVTLASLGGTITAGLVVCSHNAGALSTATFANVQVG